MLAAALLISLFSIVQISTDASATDVEFAKAQQSFSIKDFREAARRW
jgi:hypothetical protein